MMKCFFAGDLRLAHAVKNVALKIQRNLRQQNRHSAGRNADIQGDITRVMAHDLNHTAAVMALGGITQLINGLNSGIHSRIIADGILTAGNIIVNGAGRPMQGIP